MVEEAVLEKRLRPVVEPLRRIAEHTGTERGDALVAKVEKRESIDLDYDGSRREVASPRKRLAGTSGSSTIDFSSPKIDRASSTIAFGSLPLDDEVFEVRGFARSTGTAGMKIRGSPAQRRQEKQDRSRLQRVHRRERHDAGG